MVTPLPLRPLVSLPTLMTCFLLIGCTAGDEITFWGRGVKSGGPKRGEPVINLAIQPLTSPLTNSLVACFSVISHSSNAQTPDSRIPFIASDSSGKQTTINLSAVISGFTNGTE